MAESINIMVGGEAGQGVQSVGSWLAKAFNRRGYRVFGDQDYESRIRGGHNFFRVRISSNEVSAVREDVDILIDLNKETIILHEKETNSSGVIIYDNENIQLQPVDQRYIGVPLQRIAVEKAGSQLMVNSVAFGAILGLVNFDFEIIQKVLLDQFGSEEMGRNNLAAARAGYEFTQRSQQVRFGQKLGHPDGKKRMLLNGSEAIALGALAAGCKFLSAYPMTPSTPIMEYMASKATEFDIAVVQPEDEIAAVNMSIGAAFAGVRAMTVTSGSGFCLMVEGLGLSGITETPLVIVDSQRPGPAVGMPTRTEQGDLEFVINAHHGDFPRVVLAPTDVANSFWMTVKAFNLAEKYQVPVIILNDHYLATAYASIDPFDISGIKIDRGLLYSPGTDYPEADYKRHRLTLSGISERALPGFSKALVVTDSDEHGESGHLIEDAKNRKEQMDKRMRKLTELKKDIAAPELVGNKKAEVTLIGWGSTGGAIKEAYDILQRENSNISILLMNELWPFPGDAVSEILKNAKYSYVVESNATGQLARLIRQETGHKLSGMILRYDGRPITPDFIIKELKKEGIR